MPMSSPWTSWTRHRPPPIRVFVSTALETCGLPPGSIRDSTVASQTPASFLRTPCSGPGLGSGMSSPGEGADCFLFARSFWEKFRGRWRAAARESSLFVYHLTDHDVPGMVLRRVLRRVLLVPSDQPDEAG